MTAAALNADLRAKALERVPLGRLGTPGISPTPRFFWPRMRPLTSRARRWRLMAADNVLAWVAATVARLLRSDSP
jgi:hypothetical protein